MASKSLMRASRSKDAKITVSPTERSPVEGPYLMESEDFEGAGKFSTAIGRAWSGLRVTPGPYWGISIVGFKPFSSPKALEGEAICNSEAFVLVFLEHGSPKERPDSGPYLVNGRFRESLSGLKPNIQFNSIQF